MIHTIKIDGVINPETGRSSALRKCVIYNTQLSDEFHKVYPSAVDAEVEEWSRLIEEFVALRGLKIVGEKAEVEINKRGFYSVIVTYQIESDI